MDNIKIKGVPVEMGGVTRIVPPLNLGALTSLRDRLSAYKGGLDQESVDLIVDAAYLALKRNYPDINKEQIMEELDVANMDDVFKSVMDVSGLFRKKKEGDAAEGEARATNP